MPRNSDAFPLLSYLDGLMDQLHQKVPGALGEFDSEAIHDARVATRRLKAALDMAAPCLSDQKRKPFQKRLKRLRKRLGPLRDLDVMLEHLRGQLLRPAHGRASTWLADQLDRCRQKRRDKSRRRAAPADVLARLGAWWPVRQEIIEAREAIDSLLAESLHLQLDAFCERAAAADSDPGGAEKSVDHSDPHQLRIAGKRLRYTLELAQKQGHQLPASILHDFKNMQELLGKWHDRVVLVQQVLGASRDQALAYHDPALQEALLRLAVSSLRTSERDLSRFGALWRRRGQEVSRMIREMFPLTHPVNEPQTDPGPTGSNDTAAPEGPPPGAV